MSATQNSTGRKAASSELNGPRSSEKEQKAKSVKKVAKSAAKTAKSKAESAAKNARAKAEKTASKAAKTASKQVEDVAQSAVSQTRDQVEQMAESGLGKTEHLVSSVSRAAQAAGRSLEDDGMHRTAAYVNAAAKGLDRAASEVDNVDTTSIGGRVENFVRQNPMMTMGALALLGFAVAGAVKNSNNDA